MSKTETHLVNFDDLAQKRQVMSTVQGLSGLYEVTIKPRKLTRSLSQNAYYWVAVVQPFAEWLKDEWGERVELEQAHELLKHKILGSKELVSRSTGEVIEITRSSRGLDTAEFGEFIDSAANWLAEFTGIVVLPPEVFYQKKEKHARTTRQTGSGN